MLGFLLLVFAVVVINKYFSYQNTQLNSQGSKTYSNLSPSPKMVQVIKSESEFSAAIKADKLVVVDFFAVWCGPCKMIAPMLEKFSQQYSNVAFYKVDVDELPSVAQSQEVTSMPTLLFFKSGELVGKVIGANPAAIKQTIDKLA